MSKSLLFIGFSLTSIDFPYFNAVFPFDDQFIIIPAIRAAIERNIAPAMHWRYAIKSKATCRLRWRLVRAQDLIDIGTDDNNLAVSDHPDRTGEAPRQIGPRAIDIANRLVALGLRQRNGCKA